MFAIQNKSRALLRILQPAAALFAVVLMCSTPAAAAGDVKTSHEAHRLKITVLVTNVAGDPQLGDGEWGYSALVEVDGHKILYDTGSTGLSRKMAVVSAVGSSFTLGLGIDAGMLAH
jgi:hypothetical protein